MPDSEAQKEHVAVCPVCSFAGHSRYGGGYDALLPDDRRFILLKCGGCGFVYLDPDTAPASDMGLYQENYYRKMRGLSGLLERLFLEERKRTLESLKKGGALLDIGCGTGEFLRIMQLGGWNASGVEPSPAAAGHAPGVRVYRSELKDAGLAPGSFDAVTLWHVLEHLPDPSASLRELRALLKDDGVLLVSVPNIDSLQAKLGGERWFPLELPRHKWHFSPATLGELLRRCGFGIVSVRHFSLEYGPFCCWQTLFNMLGCEPSFMYKVLKRGGVGGSWLSPRRAYTLAVTALLGLPLLVVAFAITLLESSVCRGGIITVLAEKREEK